MTVEIRRRTALQATVAVLATVLAAGYLWLYVARGGLLMLAVGVVLAMVACVFAVAWSTARSPLLVADSTGVRVRLGRQWSGVPWDDMDSVEVRPRGSLSDGRVALHPRDEASVLAATGRSARWETSWNRWLYGSDLVVPYGLTTTSSAEDLPAALNELAAGRTQVVVPEPRPVEVTEQQPDGELEPLAEEAAVSTGQPPSAAEPDLAATPGSEPTADAEANTTSAEHGRDQRLPSQRTTGRHMAVVGFWEHEDETSSAPDATAKPVFPVPLRPVPGGDDGPAARREDVTIALRREPVEGTLALDDSADDVRTEELPEIGQLRRNAANSASSAVPNRRTDGMNDGMMPEGMLGGRPEGMSGEMSEEGSGAQGSGNIALIIDATTDMSARAMSKVRRPGGEPRGDGHDDGDGAGRGDGATRVGDERSEEAGGRELYIGPELRRARENLALSVDDLADRTRIRPFVIECMEADDFSPCGGDFYARGHLRMLARVLGIAPDPLIATYDEHYATSPVSLREVFDAELASGSTGMVRGGAADANWVGLAAAVVVLLVVWGVARYLMG